jgi:hypothetical protein
VTSGEIFAVQGGHVPGLAVRHDPSVRYASR